jgi:colanic acid/amylovoran biosynthesis glycosyltransferase
MRILIFSDIFGSISTTFIYNEVVELSKTHEVIYVCQERQNEKVFPFSNVEILPYKINPVSKKIRWWQEIYDLKLSFVNSRYRKDIQQIIQDFSPDLIHCHFGYEALKVLQNVYTDKIPFVVSFRGYDASQMLRRKSYVRQLKKFLFKPNVFPTFVCEFLRGNLQKNGIEVNKHLILYSGTNLDFFKRKKYDHRNEKYIFLQVSGFGDKKGHDITVKAFYQFLDQNPSIQAQLILAGSGKNMNKIQSLVKQLGLGQHVEFPGKVDKFQAKELLEKADCFVHHSVTSEGGDTEGIPNAVMEAMSMQLPVIASIHAGIPELMEDGIHGYLVDENDVDSYANRMKQIMDWKHVRESRVKIQKQFELSIHMKKLNEFYKEILFLSK